MWTWIIVGIILVVFIGVNVWMYFVAQKRQKTFDVQYDAAKERHEVFVLNKKIVKERPKQGWARFMKFKTYQVVGRISLSQTVKGMQMGRMQTVTFHAPKNEYDKIQINHRYKMDIAGNYIGYVAAPAAMSEKDKKAKAKADAAKAKATAKANANAKDTKQAKGKATANANAKTADAKTGGKKDKAK